MVAVRGKLAFSRTATIPKDNRYEHGPSHRAGSDDSSHARFGVDQGIIFVIPLTESHKSLGLCGHIFPFLPYQTYFCLDNRTDRDAYDIGQVRTHGREEEGATFALPKELKSRHDLAAVHDDPGFYA